VPAAGEGVGAGEDVLVGAVAAPAVPRPLDPEQDAKVSAMQSTRLAAAQWNFVPRFAGSLVCKRKSKKSSSATVPGIHASKTYS
jgi:hypothetical protein